jgi:uncharacterized membrane protein YkvA (DUF1232 family)
MRPVLGFIDDSTVLVKAITLLLPSLTLFLLTELEKMVPALSFPEDVLSTMFVAYL